LNYTRGMVGILILYWGSIEGVTAGLVESWSWSKFRMPTVLGTVRFF